MLLVQLGGLEPPTSCSTDRRSSQLSYNCILMPFPEGRQVGGKLGATPPFGKAGSGGNAANIAVVFAPVAPLHSPNRKPGPNGSGLLGSGFISNQAAFDQAAGLNSLLALALIGSTVSVATRWG